MDGNATKQHGTGEKNTPGLLVRELSWQPDTSRPPVLSEVGFWLEPGHIYGILGANGSGKTSLLKHILRLLPSEGAIELNGAALELKKQAQLAREMAYVPQNTAVDADFTVEEIVMMGRSPYRKRFEAPTMQDRQIVEEALRLTNCEGLKGKSVLVLSGGELQRVAAARAIAQETGWIFLDEPVASLDMRHQLELMEILSLLCRERHATVVIVLHDINLALRCCDRLLLMKEGRLHCFGETEQAATLENLREVYGLDFEELKAADGMRVVLPRLSGRSGWIG